MHNRETPRFRLLVGGRPVLTWKFRDGATERFFRAIFAGVGGFAGVALLNVCRLAVEGKTGLAVKSVG
ncbi:hypothetical protein APED_06775 [Acanthopleuribacter pedis]